MLIFIQALSVDSIFLIGIVYVLCAIREHKKKLIESAIYKSQERSIKIGHNRLVTYRSKYETLCSYKFTNKKFACSFSIGSGLHFVFTLLFGAGALYYQDRYSADWHLRAILWIFLISIYYTILEGDLEHIEGSKGPYRKITPFVNIHSYYQIYKQSVAKPYYDKFSNLLLVAFSLNSAHLILNLASERSFFNLFGGMVLNTSLVVLVGTLWWIQTGLSACEYEYS